MRPWMHRVSSGTNSGGYGNTVDSRALLDDDDLVAEHERQFRIRQFAVDDVEFGAAHAAGADADQHLIGAKDVPRNDRVARA